MTISFRLLLVISAKSFMSLPSSSMTQFSLASIPLTNSFFGSRILFISCTTNFLREL